MGMDSPPASPTSGTVPPGCTNTPLPNVLPKCKGTVAQPGWGLAAETGWGAQGTPAAPPLQPGTGLAHRVTHKEEGEQTMGGDRPQDPEAAVWGCRSE